MRVSQHANPPRVFYLSGQAILESGIYRVHHAEHRLSHEVTLIKDHIFPVCAQCATQVHFELLRAAPAIVDDPNFGFRIQLYALPAIREDDADKVAARAS